MWTEPDDFRLHRVGHVILAHLTGAPAGHVQEAIVEREIDVGNQGWNRLEPLQQRRQHILSKPVPGGLSRSSRNGICRPRATTSKSSLRGWSCRRPHRGNRIALWDRGQVAPREPSGDLRRGRWSVRCGGRAGPRSAPYARICWTADPLARCRFRTAAAAPIRLIPYSRVAGSTRNHSACPAAPRSISQRPITSKVSQSMMKMPGGPSVPSGPPPPKV